MREKKWLLSIKLIAIFSVLAFVSVLLFVNTKHFTEQIEVPEEKITRERLTIEEIGKCLPSGYSIISNDLIYHEDVNNDDFEEVVLIAKKKNKISETLTVLKYNESGCEVEKQFEPKLGAYFEDIIIKDLNANNIPEIIITTAFTNKGNIPGVVSMLEWNNITYNYEIIFSEEAILFYDGRPEIESWSKRFIRDLDNDGTFEVIIPTEDSYKIHYNSPEIDYISFLHYNIYKWNNDEFLKADSEFIEIYEEELILAERFFKDENTKVDDRRIILKHIEKIRDIKETSKVVGWNTYLHEKVGFSIKYPFDLNVVDPFEYFSENSEYKNYNEEFMKNNPVLVFDLNRDKYKETNLEYAYLSIGASHEADILKKCLPNDLTDYSVENEKIIIAGDINFYKDIKRDKVSEGKYIDVASYNTIYGNTCYSIKGVIYAKGLTDERMEELREMKLGDWRKYLVDEPEIFDKFEKIVESFSFIKDNSIEFKLNSLPEKIILNYLKNYLNNALIKKHNENIKINRIIAYDRNSKTPKINILAEDIKKGLAINAFFYFNQHNIKFENIKFLEERFLEETKTKIFLVGPDVRIKDIDRDNSEEIIENLELGFTYKWDDKNYVYKAININPSDLSQTSFTVLSNAVEKYKCTEGKKELTDLTPPQQILTVTCSKIETNKDFDVLKLSIFSPRDERTSNMYTVIKKNNDGNFLIIQIRTTTDIDDAVSNYNF